MNMRKLNNQKFTTGFTLIELLVVIAIIGILSGIVLTSLGTARNKAKSASAQASMSSMRSQAELGVDSGGNYVASICTSDLTGGLNSLKAAVVAQAGAGTVTCNQTPAAPAQATAWAASVNLSSLSGTFFCVDSTGSARAHGTALGTDTVCPAS